jgi:hypothetical protein
MAKRMLAKQMEEKRKMQEEAEKLKKIREEADRKNKEFKLMCVFSKIEQHKRNQARSAFSTIVKCNIHLKSVEIKVRIILINNKKNRLHV